MIVTMSICLSIADFTSSHTGELVTYRRAEKSFKLPENHVFLDIHGYFERTHNRIQRSRFSPLTLECLSSVDKRSCVKVCGAQKSSVGRFPPRKGFARCCVYSRSLTSQIGFSLVEKSHNFVTSASRKKSTVCSLKSVEETERVPNHDKPYDHDRFDGPNENLQDKGVSRSKINSSSDNTGSSSLSAEILPMKRQTISANFGDNSDQERSPYENVVQDLEPGHAYDERRKLSSESCSTDHYHQIIQDDGSAVQKGRKDILESSSEGNDETAETTSTANMDDYSSEPLIDWNTDTEYVTRISVPRHRYIRVPKENIVNALLSFTSANKDGSKILSICSYLELILHAKHKVLLEELRADYRLIHISQDGRNSNLVKGSNKTRASVVASNSKLEHAIDDAQNDVTNRDLMLGVKDSPVSETVGENVSKSDKQPSWQAWGMRLIEKAKSRKTRNVDSRGKIGEVKAHSESSENAEARAAAAEHFQENFLRILKSAQFEGLSAQDLELTAALNSDYLLTLPVVVDWKRTSLSNVIIFRRGYAMEQQKGLLLGAKLDYLQSSFLRNTVKGFARPLFLGGRWCLQKWDSLRKDEDGRAWAETLKSWLQEPLRPGLAEDACDGSVQKGTVDSRKSEMDMPMWEATQQAVPRYEAVLSSAGSRGLLIRGILIRMGLLPSEPISTTLTNDGDQSNVEPHLRPNYLSRVSMKDIWFPASKVAAGRSLWKRVSTAFSVFFSEATLQEPAFQELVLLYNEVGLEESKEERLHLQMYKTIPLPDLKIVFPSKKLSFRLIDTVRLDLTTLLGLSAFLLNYHFDNFLSSPSAFALDVIASSALLVFVVRAALGYKQTWDRYQLLVNKTLYEKTLASGFGVVQFLLDASEEQQFKEAILVFLLLSQHGGSEGMSKEQLVDACEHFLYYRCKEQVEMPLESAIDTLLELGLAYICEKASTVGVHVAEVRYKALTYEEGLKSLEQHWLSLPSSISLWDS